MSILDAIIDQSITVAVDANINNPKLMRQKKKRKENNQMGSKATQNKTISI
uniref:Uncharacterized protein n=1 Tax=Arundo donax TaxID=35708 RepID=A0A0A9SBL4_ARUDO